MKKLNLLSRAEMRKVTGGLLSTGTCSATCGDRTDAVCTGTGCQAIDGTGCTADGNISVSCVNQPKKDIE